MSIPLTLSSRTHGRSITEPTSPIPAARSRSWLTKLLAGEVQAAPFAPAAVSRVSGADSAVAARALGCPDVFLLDCAEAPTRESHILNIVRAASDRGERLLVLSPDPAAADRLVEALASDRTVRAVRALSDDENPLRPSPVVSRLTSVSAGPHRAEQLRREALQTVQTLEAKIGRQVKSRELQAKLDAIERERVVLANPAKAAEPPARCVEIQAERETIRIRRVELEKAPAAKSGIIARLFGRTKPSVDHAAELKQLAESDATLLAECEAATRQRTAEAEQETARRLADLEAESAQVDAALRELHPQAASEDTVENGSRGPSQELERELAVARTRHQELTAAGTELHRRLLAETQVVVGTPGAVGSDAVFAALGPAPFERLLLDHAEELTEAAFHRFAPLAAKWILAGDASPPPPPASNGRPPRARPAEPNLLPRLAKLLDREPWRTDGERLVIRLVHLAPSQRADLTREPLIDHPDVELGVVMVDGEPVVAEIAFPAATAIPEAKSFLFSQLGEVVLRTCGEPQWSGLTVSWSAFDSADGEWIELEAGVREKVCGRGAAAFTGAIEFDPASWDDAAAREWVAARTSHSASRIAILPCVSKRPPAYSHATSG